jgi:GNAT superfamily N-acetyltransferase
LARPPPFKITARHADTNGMTATLHPAPLAPLTRSELTELFEDEFTLASGHWEVVVTCVEESDQMVEGIVLLSGAEVGRFMRIVRGGAAAVVHLSMGLDEGARRKGFSARWLQSCRERYRAAGLTRIIVSASGEGTVAWARLGFEVSEREWLRLLADAGKLDGVAHDQLEVLRASEPRLLALEGVHAGGASVLSQLGWHGAMAA